ncbi:MAG: helix-turn-helix domain-containing protein [Massilibacteroides sp.]|nr:helix-turn-helix domain-containing protein [Massilibacteroides sp.]MDD3062024.1 helix-turn-helix domain-containing protein [Massilibacteroides sp.]MDD4114837.1 helix-turn-helix domain-containing protein [Massilibacteroides sp.]MDD4659259.1 helix-turn-helix domain-containing protein [Massilibacteroides sp.]
MQSLYFATTFASAIVCLLTSLLVFVQRKKGERSRVILACIILFSVGNYITRFFTLCHGEEPKLVISVPMLLLAIFMVISYIMYPIEVISPGFLNCRRIIWLYSPWLLLVAIYIMCRQIGVTFHPYHSLFQMVSEAETFQVWFRFLLSILLFTPALFIFAIPYTRRYNNTDKIWIRKYLFCFTLNIMAYEVLLVFDSLLIKTLYYYASVGCSLYIAYMELFERLIELRPTLIEQTNIPNIYKISHSDKLSVKQNPLCKRIILYMEQTCDYRNPDISLNMLARSLFTNRTTLSKALHELGYSSFNTYINTLRIEDFIQHVHNKEFVNYQDAFYDVGFRSRTTALRNFKQYTGKTPSEYFSG